MAVLEGIRQKTGLLLIFVAGALVLFLIQGFASDLQGYFRADGENYKGQIGDVRIKAEEFERRYNQKEALTKQSFVQRGETMPDYYTNTIKQQVWNEYVHKHAYAPIYEQAGVVVTDEGSEKLVSEKVDLFQGRTISDGLKKQFTWPNTPFSADSIKNYLRKIGQITDINQRKYEEIQLSEYTSSLTQERHQEKFLSLFDKSNYITEVEAKRKHQEQNSTVSFDYVYIPFSSLEDSAVSFADADLKSHLRGNINKFEFKDGRTVDFVMFDVLPSSEDTLRIFKSAAQAAADFKATSSNKDTTFYKFNSDKPAAPKAYTYEQLPSQLKEDSSFLKAGYVKGPVSNYLGYDIYKVLSTRTDEMAQTAHILINYGADSAAAKVKALEVLEKAKAGDDFGLLAKQYSEDPGSKDKGGEYPATAKGSGWVKPFEDAVFEARKTGVVSTLVETQFGYHIMKVLKTSFQEDKFIVVKITKDLVPSKATKDIKFREANMFKKDIGSLEEFTAAAEKVEALDIITSPLLKRTSKSLGAVYNADNVVAWAFNPETKVGSVSKVFAIPGGNKFVVASLKRISDKDNPQVDDERSTIERSLINELKAENLKKLLESTEGDLYVRSNKLNEDNGQGFAKFESIKGHNYGKNAIPGIGLEPKMIGLAMGLNVDEWSKTIVGQSGVFIIRTTAKSEAKEVADYSSQKADLAKLNNNERLAIANAIKEFKSIKDNDQ